MPPSIIQLQRELEDFPDEKLVQEAQQPTEYPAYLSTQELKRRASLREKYQARQAQVPQGTVAERQVQEAMQNMAPMGPMGGAQPPGMPPQGGPPQGMPPQGGLPPGMPPQGGPPQGMPPQGGPPPMAHGGLVGLKNGGSRFRVPDQDDIPFEGWTTEEILEHLDPTLGGTARMEEIDAEKYGPEEADKRYRQERRQRIKGKIGGFGGKLIKGIGALGLGADLLMSPEHAGAGTVPESGRTAEERKALMDHTRSSMEKARSFGTASIDRPRSFSDILHGRASGGLVGLHPGGIVEGDPGHPWHHDDEIRERISEIERLNPKYEQIVRDEDTGRYARREFDTTPEYLSRKNPDYARAQRELGWLDEYAGEGDPDTAAIISGIQEQMRGLEGDYLGQRVTSGTETGLPSIADISEYSPEFGELSDKLSWYSGAGDEGPIWRQKPVDAAQAVEDAVAEAEAEAAAASAAASAAAVDRPPAEFDLADHPVTGERIRRLDEHEDWLRKPTDSEVAYEDFLGGISQRYLDRIPSDEQNLARERSEILDSLIAGFGGTGRGGFSKAFREAGGTKDVWLERDRQKAEREKYEDASDEILAKRYGIKTLRSRQNVAEQTDRALGDLVREVNANKRAGQSSAAAVQAAWYQVEAANAFRDPGMYEEIRQQLYRLMTEVDEYGNPMISRAEYDLIMNRIKNDIVEGMSGGLGPGVNTTSRMNYPAGAAGQAGTLGTG